MKNSGNFQVFWLFVLGIAAFGSACESQQRMQRQTPMYPSRGPFATGPSSGPFIHQNPNAAYPPSSPQGSYPQPQVNLSTSKAPSPPYSYSPLPSPKPANEASRVGLLHPLLPPLFGSAMMQDEVKMILSELINSLPAQDQARVFGIPLAFDSNPSDVNAFAGCDHGAPFMAATEGLLQVVHAISETVATDELFRTQTYVSYTQQVILQMLRSEQANVALPSHLIPFSYVNDVGRTSRAHELFDEIMAFTFGHELAHHYLGHTGCANGQRMTQGPSPEKIARVAADIIPLLNQVNEAAADTNGTYNALDAGLFRSTRGQFRYTEKGGVLLLDFFGRLAQASGGNLFSLSNILLTHPFPTFRIGFVSKVADDWYRNHPTVVR